MMENSNSEFCTYEAVNRCCSKKGINKCTICDAEICLEHQRAITNYYSIELYCEDCANQFGEKKFSVYSLCIIVMIFGLVGIVVWTLSNL